jgi:ribonuclease HI
MCGVESSLFQKCNTHLSSFVHLLEYSMQRFSKDQVELLAVVARKVWLRRNSLVFEGVLRHPKEVLEEAILSLEEFRKWNSLEEFNVLQPEGVSFSKIDRWSPPHLGRVKVNWDASINSKEKCIGVGIVARNSLGDFVGGRSVMQKIETDSSTTESMAALMAVLFSKELGLSEVIFEGDIAQVISDINSPPPHFSKAGHITESMSLELEGFQYANFVHVPKELNSVAHVLAKKAAMYNLDCCWLEEISACISNLVLGEKSFVPRSPVVG